MIYHVIANDGRITGIEADSYTALLASGIYVFTNNKAEDQDGVRGHQVAIVNAGATFAVVEDDALLGSFYPDDEGPDDQDQDDVCPDCRILELLDTEEFTEAVIDVIDSYCCAREEDEDTPPEDEPPTSQVPIVPKVEHRRNIAGDLWGFVLPLDTTRFVGFSEEKYAKSGAQKYADGDHSDWFSLPVSETTLVGDGQ
jgi:hypothetical protein